jgi:hypothetical protein
MATKEKNKSKKAISVPLNNGINMPVADKTPTHTPSKIETALFKQAENPLGDPHKL